LLKILLITDKKSGHQSVSNGIIKSLQKDNEILITEVYSKIRAKFLKKIATIALNNINLNSRNIPIFIKFFYKDIQLDLHQKYDLIISTGGDTAFLNILASKYSNTPNIYCSSLRGLKHSHFTHMVSIMDNHIPNEIVVDLPPVHVEIKPKSLEGKYLAVLIGAATKNYRFDDNDFIKIVENSINIADKKGYKILLTTSRRTPIEVENRIEKLCVKNKNIVERFVLFNKKPQKVMSYYLSNADAIICTEDSGSMITESILSKKRVYTVKPKNIKLNRVYSSFMQNIQNRGYILSVEIEKMSKIRLNERFNFIEIRPSFKIIKAIHKTIKDSKKMKIGYFINTFNSTNWGGQATSSGIKYLLSKSYKDAKFYPIDLPELKFKKIKILRKYFELKLTKAIINDNDTKVVYFLSKLNIQDDIFSPYTHICFNGEGAIHYKSGHLVRLMGMLYLAKIQGKIVASINQTIDFNHDKTLETLVSKVYNLCDFVSFREPISFDLAKSIGIKRCCVLPDAVYGLPIMTKDEILQIKEKYKLPKRYITVTGSSILKRDKDSIKKMTNLFKAIKYTYKKLPIFFMASTKTDLFLAKKLKDNFNLTIITAQMANYQDAIAIFANSMILLGGRQHPNIFAYIYKVPYIGFDGNTFKNRGVAKLQEYPIPLLSWESDFDRLVSTIESVKNGNIVFKDIKIDSFEIFKG